MALGVAGAAGVLVPRLAREQASRGPVELTFDWPSLQAAAEQWDRPPAELVRELAKAGVTSLAVPEQTAGELVSRGDALLMTPVQMEMLRLPAPAAPVQSPVTWLLQPGQPPLAIPAAAPRAHAFGVGLPQDALAAAREAGLPVLLRYADRPRIVPWFDAQATKGVPASRVVIFEGARVPDLETVRPPMEEGHFAVGLVEFAGQAGAAELARSLGMAGVAVHSMKSEEIERAGVDASIDRYVRAVRERGVRVLYLRPAPQEQDTLALVAGLAGRLRAEGYTMGLARPAPLWRGPGALTLLLAGVGAAGLLLWLVAGWASAGGAGARALASPLVAVAAAALGVLSGAVLVVAHARGWDSALSVLARQMGAFGVALVAPVAAMAAGLSVAGRPQRPDGSLVGSRGQGSTLRALGAWLAVALVGLIGGLLVASLLSDSLFMLRLEQFRGVKLVHVLPPVTVAAGALALAGADGEQVRRWLVRPVRWVDAALAVVLVAAGAYYVLRTGNEAGAVSELERALRGWLETGLSVRPRTKEFLIGYPALAAGLFMWSRGWAREWPLLWAGVMGAASIAPVSVTNTFAHLHTPLVITLQRELNGMALGLLAAALVWAVAGRLEAGARRRARLRAVAGGQQERSQRGLGVTP
ncbi:DUF5693 family protein [Carboxydochorda subterranea]|uniref:DUF5693 family protein n=1 Tax=Carboxydichorda subterranea TaxID=3109565 RepID=A0ABZ1BZJ7_9FIRM|nr:DUF5693 family protein [Limnochorda sp. L945t]WRP18000.1 DUF5693 family protein [Limnochorda sp. L945t]